MEQLKGKIICLVGGEASGKTTLKAALARVLRPRLQSIGGDLVQTREPGGTEIGRALRQILLQRPDLALTPLDEAVLFSADRALHYRDVVLPAVQSGKTVLMDRCFVETFVYQSFVGGVPRESVERLTRAAVAGVRIDLCIGLDIEPELCLQRRTEALTRQDRMPLEWHRRIRQGYQALVPPPGCDPSQRIAPDLVRQIAWIDARQSPESVLNQALRAIERAFGACDLIA